VKSRARIHQEGVLKRVADKKKAELAAKKAERDAKKKESESV
jgi:hypothetical protein